MDKEKEKAGIEDLLNHLGTWSLVSCAESPDFVIKNEAAEKYVGVEVTTYYPNRTKKGSALVRIPGKNREETMKNKLRFFEKTDFGYARFAPRHCIDDFYKNCIKKKEEKLGLYKNNAPKCQKFWLLVMLDHYDNVVFEDAEAIRSAFDKVFIWEETRRVYEFPVIKEYLKWIGF